MIAIPSRRWLWLAVGLSGLWAVLLLTNALPILRGPAPWPPEWRWPYEPLGSKHLTRQIVELGLMMGYLIVSMFLLRKRYIKYGLTLAVVFLFMWQLSQTWVREQSLLDTIIFRTYAPPISGYMMTSAQVNDLNNVLHHYAESLGAFSNYRHRTHPPGLFLFYTLTNNLFQQWSGFSSWLGPIARTWAIPGRDWPLLPDYLIASAFVTAWMQIMMTALTPLGLYFFIHELSRGRSTDWAMWSAMALPFIPAIGLFLSQWDTTYPLLGLMAWALVLRAQNLGSRMQAWLLWLLAGMILSLMTWLSYGLLIMIAMVVLHGLVRAFLLDDRRSVLMTLLGLLIMVGGLVLPWLGAWIVWDMRFDQLFTASLAQHFNLVTYDRRYSLWLWGNLLDFALWLGPGVLLLGIVSIFHAWSKRSSDPLVMDVAVAGLIFWTTIGILNLLGMSRGEVGRLWLFLMPYPLAFALFPDWGFRGRSAILIMMALWSVLIAWIIPPFGII